MRARPPIIAAIISAALAAPASRAEPASLTAPIANPDAGAVIEVPPVPQPGISRSGPPSLLAREPGAEPVRPASVGAESRSLGKTSAPKQAPGTATPESSGGWIGHWSVRTLAAVMALAALLAGVRWLSARSGSGGGLSGAMTLSPRAPSGILEVLGRYPVSRGHSLVLMRMDRRIVLLGQSAAGFTTLSEVTDPDDVASILVKASESEPGSMTRRFNELLRGMERDARIVDAEQAPTASPVSPRRAMRLAQGGGA